MSELIVGAWRNGLGISATSVVEQTVDKAKVGFRMLPAEQALLDLVDTLDGYEAFASEVLTEWADTPKRIKAE